MNQLPGKFVRFKRAGGDIPASMAGVDIQHVRLMPHCVQSCDNYDITPEQDLQLLWYLMWSPSSVAVP